MLTVAEAVTRSALIVRKPGSAQPGIVDFSGAEPPGVGAQRTILLRATENARGAQEEGLPELPDGS